MKFVRKVEDLFEKYIDGFFSSRFAGGLQPVEIAKRLSREMDSDKTVGIAKVYVPNQFSVFLSGEDYEKLNPYGQSIRDEIAAYVAEEAKRKGYTIVGKPIVDIFMNEMVKRGSFRVESRYTEPIPEEQSPAISADTQVFEKVLQPERKQQFKRNTGLLTVIEGQDMELSFDLGGERVNIGRRESNELPLNDMNTSRLHAYITYEEGSHTLYDAKSLNGTYVNNCRITRKVLKSGDKIKLGNTVILYEVK
ncbi:MAG: domain containing protein [Firmicutes bacterium]|nr:domain containing protein [Bacillota bacterium]